MKIAETLKRVLERIHSAAAKAGRNTDDIKLVAVTKTVALPGIIEAINAGVKILGENRVQEAQKKVTELRAQNTEHRLIPLYPPLVKGGWGDLKTGGVEWHLIGNLQKNKVKYAVQLFDLIHAIDSIPLADEVNKQSEKIGKEQRVLVEIKLSDEPAKHGVSEKDLIELLEKISGMKNLKLEGLMTMPPFLKDPEMVRPYFKRLREIRDAVNLSLVTCLPDRQARHLPTGQAGSLRELSMGMSSDFEVAIEEGATMIRIGTAIFGERK